MQDEGRYKKAAPIRTIPETPGARGFRNRKSLGPEILAYESTMMAESEKGDGFTGWFTASLASSQFMFSKVNGFSLPTFANSIKKARYRVGADGKAGYVELEDQQSRRYRVYVVGSVEQMLGMLPKNEVEEMAPTALKMGTQLCYIYPQR